MSKLILYGTITSPPVRAVLMALKELDLEYEFKKIDVHAGETRTEAFLKINPQHTVPVLEDDGQYIADSHAILAYLARKYGKTDYLYPEDYYQRAVVDQRLYFDAGQSFAEIVKIYKSKDLSKEEKLTSVAACVEECYSLLEIFVQNSYMAGDHLTIADLSLVSRVSALDLIVPVSNVDKRPKLTAWYETITKLPYYDEVNAEGIKGVSIYIKSLSDTD